MAQAVAERRKSQNVPVREILYELGLVKERAKNEVRQNCDSSIASLREAKKKLTQPLQEILHLSESINDPVSKNIFLEKYEEKLSDFSKGLEKLWKKVLGLQILLDHYDDIEEFRIGRVKQYFKSGRNAYAQFTDRIIQDMVRLNLHGQITTNEVLEEYDKAEKWFDMINISNQKHREVKRRLEKYVHGVEGGAHEVKRETQEISKSDVSKSKEAAKLAKTLRNANLSEKFRKIADLLYEDLPQFLRQKLPRADYTRALNIYIAHQPRIDRRVKIIKHLLERLAGKVSSLTGEKTDEYTKLHAYLQKQETTLLKASWPNLFTNTRVLRAFMDTLKSNINMNIHQEYRESITQFFLDVDQKLEDLEERIESLDRTVIRASSRVARIERESSSRG